MSLSFSSLLAYDDVFTDEFLASPIITLSAGDVFLDLHQGAYRLPRKTFANICKRFARQSVRTFIHVREYICSSKRDRLLCASVQPINLLVSTFIVFRECLSSPLSARFIEMDFKVPFQRSSRTYYCLLHSFIKYKQQFSFVY